LNVSFLVALDAFTGAPPAIAPFAGVNAAFTFTISFRFALLFCPSAFFSAFTPAFESFTWNL
jgi:hypothetical protein